MNWQKNCLLPRKHRYLIHILDKCLRLFQENREYHRVLGGQLKRLGQGSVFLRLRSVMLVLLRDRLHANIQHQTQQICVKLFSNYL